MTLKCCNPACNQEAQRNQWFCSDTCYAKVEHSFGQPKRIPMTHFERAAMILGLVSTTALGFTAFFS